MAFSTYQLTGAMLMSQAQIGVVYTSEVVPVGTVVQGTDAVGQFAEYIFLKGVGSTIVGSVVTYDDAGATTLLVTTAKGPVAVALAICDATTEYAWYGRTGIFPTDVVANSADNARLGFETTAGKVGDGFTAGDQIVGAIQRVATTAAAVVNCQFDRPFVGVNVA